MLNDYLNVYLKVIFVWVIFAVGIVTLTPTNTHTVYIHILYNHVFID